MSARAQTSTRPESQAQVLQWEKTKRRYLQAGLCHKCAAQAAWACQLGAGGWGPINPPCPECAEIVAMFPWPTSNPLWRAVLRKRL